MEGLQGKGILMPHNPHPEESRVGLDGKAAERKGSGAQMTRLGCSWTRVTCKGEAENEEV